MVVSADYVIGSVPIATTEITGYTVTPKTLTEETLKGNSFVTISYTEGSVKCETTQPITLTPVVTQIAVTTIPTKTTYMYNDTLSTSGMVVTGTYSDGSTKPVTGYTCSPTSLKTVTNNQTIQVSYTENGITKTTSFSVVVNRRTGSITLTPSSVTVNASNYAAGAIVNVGGNFDGTISVSQTSVSALTLQVNNSDKTITVTGDGNTKVEATAITVSVSEGTNYTAASATLTIAAQYWEWGDQTAAGAGNAEWWAGLKNWVATASTSELSACVGKTKSVTLTSAVQGTTTHLVTCIGYNLDRDKSNTSKNTLTFHTTNTLATTTVFGTSNGLWRSSTVRNLCTSYYNAFPGKAQIITVSKGTCTTTNSSQAGTPTYYDEQVFLPSDCEMGFPKGANYSNGLGYATSYDEFCQQNTSKTAYQYYTSNERRIKKQGDSGSAMHYWERSLYYNGTSNACRVYGDGKPNNRSYNVSFGFAPAFAI